MRPILLLVFLLLCCRANLSAQDSAIVISQQQSLQLARYGQIAYLRDKTGQMKIQEVLASRAFTTLDKQIPNFSITSDVIWLRFSIRNQSGSNRLRLAVSNPILDYVDLYYPDNNGQYQAIAGGELTPYEQRPVKHQNFTYRLRIPEGQTQTFYLRVQSREPVLVPIYAGTPGGVERKNNLDDLLLMLYVMVLLVMIFYNIFIVATVRDKSYVYYILYIIAVGMTQVCLMGFGYRFLWHHSRFITEQSVYWTGALSGITVALFVQRFLHVKERAPLAYKIFNGFIYAYTVAILLAVLRFYSLSYIIIDLLAITGVTYILGFVLVQTFKGYRAARFFLIAWFIFILSVALFVLKDTGIIPYNIFTSHVLLIGSGIEVILLSLALADRINTYKKEKEESQAIALSVSQENERLVREQNVILETKVTERTVALQQANNELNIALRSLKEAQTRLVEKEKMASLGQLTAGIAHEINNPINFVTSNIKPLKLDMQDIKTLLDKYSRLAQLPDIHQGLQEIERYKKEIDLDYIHSEIADLIKGIEDGAARTAEIVKGLRTFSRLDESEVKYVDIHEGLDSTLVLLRNSVPPNVKIIKRYGDLPKIECYAGKVNQVFMNIFTNAFNAIKNKQSSGEECVTITTSQENEEFARISIRDTGTGMTAAVRERIFDPFFTTKDVGEGTGLGLSIVFSIIEKHNGRIIVDSAPGKGAEFIIYLPLKIKNLPT